MKIIISTLIEISVFVIYSALLYKKFPNRDASLDYDIQILLITMESYIIIAKYAEIFIYKILDKKICKPEKKKRLMSKGISALLISIIFSIAFIIYGYLNEYIMTLPVLLLLCILMTFNHTVLSNVIDYEIDFISSKINKHLKKETAEIDNEITINGKREQEVK